MSVVHKDGLIGTFSMRRDRPAADIEAGEGQGFLLPAASSGMTFPFSRLSGTRRDTFYPIIIFFFRASTRRTLKRLPGDEPLTCPGNINGPYHAHYEIKKKKIKKTCFNQCYSLMVKHNIIKRCGYTGRYAGTNRLGFQ